jgi:uncharacterized protein (DUF2384 family)
MSLGEVRVDETRAKLTRNWPRNWADFVSIFDLLPTRNCATILASILAPSKEFDLRTDSFAWVSHFAILSEFLLQRGKCTKQRNWERRNLTKTRLSFELVSMRVLPQSRLSCVHSDFPNYSCSMRKQWSIEPSSRNELYSSSVFPQRPSLLFLCSHLLASFANASLRNAKSACMLRLARWDIPRASAHRVSTALPVQFSPSETSRSWSLAMVTDCKWLEQCFIWWEAKISTCSDQWFFFIWKSIYLIHRNK